MSTVCVTGSTDGIGLAAARALLDEGHRVLVHARTSERGERALAEAGLRGDVDLVTGDLGDLADVHRLAEQVAERSGGALDVLAHNAGVWVRGGTPRTSAQGVETTFAVNVLAPHLLTALLADALAPRARVLWLGSGMARSGRPDPDAPGGPTDPREAYATSKAWDVALAQAWARRLAPSVEGVVGAAVDPGWVVTKLATPGAPGTPEQGADTLVWCATAHDLATGYYKGRRQVALPDRVADAQVQDALAAACDRLLAEVDPGAARTG